MSEVSQLNDDEIDLFELFETLWRGKVENHCHHRYCHFGGSCF